MSTVLASAADERYGDHLLNMIASVKANSDVFDAILAYDLGLSARQRDRIGRFAGVELHTVPPFVPHWAQGRTWKPWIWTHAGGERLLWLDAGLTVLRPLDEALRQVDERGYFAVSQGHPAGDSIPEEWYEELGIPRAVAARTSIAAGIFGFARGSDFYERVVVPVYEDCLRGLSVGFSPDELAGRNVGLDAASDPVVRNCKHFRWDQSVLNARFHTALADPFVNDLDRFAGWRSARDHPEQVIWSHRRQGRLRYLPLPTRLRWRWRTRPRWLRSATYLWKIRGLLSG